MTRSERSILRVLLVGAAACAACVGPAAAAAAHVTVHPPTVTAGSSDVELTFRVPDERDQADTVEVQVFLPADLPLLTVGVLPVPGWSSTTASRMLAKPVPTDDGTVDRVVSAVTWTATGGGIAPGQYEDFPISVGSMPDHVGALVFKALQTYSSGEIVRWIEVPVAGQPEPDTPAPVLTLVPAVTAAAAVGSGGGEPAWVESVAVAALALAAASMAGVVLLARRRGAGRGA